MAKPSWGMTALEGHRTVRRRSATDRLAKGRCASHGASSLRLLLRSHAVYVMRSMTYWSSAVRGHVDPRAAGDVVRDGPR